MKPVILNAVNRRQFLGWLGGGVAAGAGASAARGEASGRSDSRPGTDAGWPGAAGRARFSLRVGVGLWGHPERLTELTGWCREYRSLLDEVALFTSVTHAPLPLAEVERRARVLAEVLPRFRETGLAAGINHLATLGHADEDVERALQEPWGRLTDYDGTPARACYCASDPRVLAYVERCYEILAAADPDFVWVDDDLRLESRWPVRFGCFCEACLSRFSRETGQRWTRAELVKALNRADEEQRIEWRRQWLAHNRDYVAGVLRAIRAAVDRVNPHLPLGYMSAELTYSGYGWTEWPAALSGPRGLPVKWRPGGGFYTDETPTALLGKAHGIGRQVSRLPEGVTDLQYEHENYPYQLLKKSVTLATAEVAAALGAGCTGAALNCLGLGSDPIEECRPYFEGLQVRRLFYDRVVAAFAGSRCEGVWPVLGEDIFATFHSGGDWFTAPVFGRQMHALNELGELGLPMAYHPAGARVTVLWGDAVRQANEGVVEGWLAGGSLLDGPALQRVQALGLRHLAGFRVRGTRPADSVEVLVDHELNGRHAGWQRNLRTFLSPELTWLVEPTDPAARVLAEVIDLGGQRFGPTAGTFENPLGGRVAVAGYSPWRHLQSEAKVRQMRALCRWLSRDTLPALVETYARVALWCRCPAGRPPAVLVLNASVDPVAPLEVLVRGVTRLRLTREDGAKVVLSLLGHDGPYGRFRIPRLGPWEPVLLEGEEAGSGEAGR